MITDYERGIACLRSSAGATFATAMSNSKKKKNRECNSACVGQATLFRSQEAMKSCASIAASFVKADLSRESQSLPACLEM